MEKRSVGLTLISTLSAAMVALGLATAIVAAAPRTIVLQVNRTSISDGQSVVATVLAKTPSGTPISGLKVRALVNGEPWCASAKTLPSGVAHLLLPLPEVGANAIAIRGGGVTSAPVTVRVKHRRFKIITDPKH